MGEKTFFISGKKSFELIYNGDAWFTLIERSHHFTSRINIDDGNLRWICDILQQASKGNRDIYRRWGRTQQKFLYRVYQNYNIYSRFIRIEVQQGDKKTAIIIPEVDHNCGWADIAGKILRFIGNFRSRPQIRPPVPLLRSYYEAAKVESWPETISQPSNHPLSRSLIGTFNDPFHFSPNPDIIQKWFIASWNITAGLRVTPIDHNCFLFEFPSREEAARTIAGDWFWNGRHLSLSWWTPSSGRRLPENNPDTLWLKVFGVPLHAWSPLSFKNIGEKCGGYIGIDEDTKNRKHFFWDRICVRNSGEPVPATLLLEMEGLNFEISILEENRPCPLPSCPSTNYVVSEKHTSQTGSETTLTQERDPPRVFKRETYIDILY